MHLFPLYSALLLNNPDIILFARHHFHIFMFSGCHLQCCHQKFTSDLTSRITFAGKITTKIKNWPRGSQNLLSWAKEYIQKGRGKECRRGEVLDWLEIVEIRQTILFFLEGNAKCIQRAKDSIKQSDWLLIFLSPWKRNGCTLVENSKKSWSQNIWPWSSLMKFRSWWVPCGRSVLVLATAAPVGSWNIAMEYRQR